MANEAVEAVAGLSPVNSSIVCCCSVVTVRPVGALVQSTGLSWLSGLAASSRGRESGDKRAERNRQVEPNVGTN